MPTRNSIADIRFENNGLEANLSQLLTVHGWMPGTVSRVMFYNARTKNSTSGKQASGRDRRWRRFVSEGARYRRV